MVNSIDTKIRLLWLSDIHYMSDYGSVSGSGDLKAFLSGFHEYVETFNPTDFDYILLSGDIAQEGIAADYAQFEIDILGPLQERFKEAELLVVPGNHDVARSDAAFIQQFLSSLSDSDSKRLSFFGADVAGFEKIFRPYTDAFKDHKGVPAQSSDTYRQTMLYGHVLDIKRKVIFVLLNTSWYSLGNDFLKTYIREFLLSPADPEIDKIQPEDQEQVNQELAENLKAKEFEDKVNRLSKEIAEIAEEYGKQLVGLDHLKDIEKISELIDDYSDFLVVTVMHHPLNWLSWGERVTSSPNKFHEIRKQTDLLLTGHEHVPRIHGSEQIHNILHLQAGCFMSAVRKGRIYRTFDKDDPKAIENWFSTLEINIKKRTVKQEKHYYDLEDRTWKRDSTYTPKKLNNKHYSTLSIKRRNAILSGVATPEGILMTLQSLYSGIKRINANLFIWDDKIIIFNADNQLSVDPQSLKPLIAKYNATIVQFLFIDVANPMHIFYLNAREREVARSGMPDFSVLANKAGIKGDKQADRLVILEAIKNDYDFRFDRLRYDFFKSLSDDEALSFKDLRFVSMIKPYWEFESCIERK